jgi:Tol biopolymer transport system component
LQKWEDVFPAFPHVPSVSYHYNGIPENIYYNKSLSHVAYLEDADAWQTIIYDVKNNKVVWKGNKDLFGDFGWSPDGTKIVLEKSLEKGRMALVSIDLNGDEKLFSSTNDIIYSIEFSWSPNSKLIAAWLDSPSHVKSLSIIDPENNKITDYCIDEHTTRGYSPRWSPDNNFVAVPVIDDKRNVWTTIVLDIHTGQAYRLSDNDVVFGWMVKP